MATVEFDVGGTIYKVSKSLLEMDPDTMLASLASPRWKDDTNNGESKPIFIERNGERFQYVLDYMRDNGKVNLPVSVSPNAVVDDLEYFGFENVKTAGKFHVAYPSSVAAFANLKEANTYFNENSITIARKHKCMELAKRCFQEMCRTTPNLGRGNVTLYYDDPLVEAARNIAENIPGLPGWKEEFDALLKPVGMRVQQPTLQGRTFSFSFVESST